MMFRNSNGSFWGKRGIESIERDQPEQRLEDVYELESEVPMSIDELSGLYADLAKRGMTSDEVLKHRE